MSYGNHTVIVLNSGFRNAEYYCRTKAGAELSPFSLIDKSETLNYTFLYTEDTQITEIQPANSFAE